jgi:SAM-dependent methyltransferase
MIRFVAKVATQRVLGAVPGGRRVYGAMQRHLTRSVVPTRETLADKVAVAERLTGVVTDAGAALTTLGPYLDIGCGWLPVVPLHLRRQGLGPQTWVDIAPVLDRAGLLAVERYLGLTSAGASIDDSLSRHDVTYLAPAVPPYTLASGGFGLITCLQVMQYPTPAQLRAIHAEAARLLRPGGLYVASLRLDDQYAHGDPALSRFNFLRYDDAVWRRWFLNPFTPLNRLRARDHEALLADLPFERVQWTIRGGAAAELAELDRIRPADCFAGYSRNELAQTELRFVLRRRDGR